MPNQSDLERMVREDAAQRPHLRRTAIDLVNRELKLLEMLGAAGASSLPYRKAAILYNQVLQPLEAGDYEKASRELDDFLNDRLMYSIMRLLVNEAKPTLQLILRGITLSALLRRAIQADAAAGGNCQ